MCMCVTRYTYVLDGLALYDYAVTFEVTTSTIPITLISLLTWTVSSTDFYNLIQSNVTRVTSNTKLLNITKFKKKIIKN